MPSKRVGYVTRQGVHCEYTLKLFNTSTGKQEELKVERDGDYSKEKVYDIEYNACKRAFKDLNKVFIGIEDYKETQHIYRMTPEFFYDHAERIY